MLPGHQDGRRLEMQRIPELDGLRAIAASVILASHLSPISFPPGWTGVDLFFVISGYLITSILINRPAAPGFLIAFYARRALRIWPIYYLGLAFIILVNPWLARPYELTALGYYLTYTQNVWLYWTETGPPFNPAFDHTWTLALEEQYYLLWPVLVMLTPRPWLPALCLSITALAFLGRQGFELYFIFPLVTPALPARTLLSRCDGFALGGLLAWLLSSDGPPRRRTLGVFLLAAAGTTAYLGYGFYRGGLLFLGLPTPANPALTILIVEIFYFSLLGLTVFHTGSRWLSLLRVGWLRWLGTISYGIYFYHYIIYWVVDGCAWTDNMNYDQTWTVRGTKVAITLAVATVSWNWIEQPILKLKDHFTYEASPQKQP